MNAIYVQILSTHTVHVFRRPLLKDVKAIAERQIILDCKLENIFEILKQAQQVGLMTAYHTILITSLVQNFF